MDIGKNAMLRDVAINTLTRPGIRDMPCCEFTS
jgi:hypothetical protein